VRGSITTVRKGSQKSFKEEPLYLAQMKRKCFSFALGRTQDKEEEQPAGALSAIEPEIGRSDSSSTLVRQKSDGI